MAMRLRVLVIVALVGVLAVSTGAAAQSLTPHFPGWERYFTVSWEPFEWRGQPYLSGYIVSRYGVTATRVQLLVDSLDSSDQIVAQRVEWLGGSNLPGFARTYFEVPIRQQASRYRVSVFAFEFAPSAQIQAP
jgi:hypothetical protein